MRARLSALLLAATFAPGCFFDAPEYAFIAADDLMIDPVRGPEYRALVEYGDVYAISVQSAHEVGGWLGYAVDRVGDALDLLDRFPSERDDEGYKVYGPYSPGDAGVAWLFRFDGDEDRTRFEVWVGDEGAAGQGDMAQLLRGEVAQEGSRRSGALRFDFDALEAHGDALKAGPDRDRHYTGRVDLTFERDLESDLKEIDIAYEDFTVTQEVPIHDFFSAERYTYARGEDGAGSFHVDLSATFQTLLWSGPAVERMVIDMTWGPSGAGRARGEMLQGDEGDLMLGDLVLDECFDARGALVWREISPAYAEALPDYNTGDPRACAD